MIDKTYSTFDRIKAQKLLTDFSNEKLPSYAKMRNYNNVSKEKNFVSYLSPIISRKILTEEDILKYVLKKYNFKNIEKFISEIIWKSYWRGFLETHPLIFYDYQKDLKSFEIIKKEKSYIDAVNGKTNIECFNIWVKELVSEGYLHNHARMWFSSIWIFTLKLPWQLGADYFMNHLLDGDLASNTLSWRWVAGLHTKGKHYIAYPENIKKYTYNRFFPKNDLNTNSLPMKENKIYTPQLIDYKDELYKNKSKSALIIHENDLSLKNTDYYDFIFIQLKPSFKLNQSKRINQYMKSCLSKNFEILYKKYPGKVFGFTLSDPKKFNELVLINNIRYLSMSYPYLSDLKIHLNKFLSEIQIEVNLYNSKWDKKVWPHCSKGFFKLKRKIPHLLEEYI